MTVSISAHTCEQLESLLRAIANDPRADRVARLQQLARCVAAERPADALDWICDCLEREANLRDGLGKLLAGELLVSPFHRELSDTGSHVGHGLFAQTAFRVGRKLVPPVPPAGGAQAVLHAIAASSSAARWVAAAGADRWRRLLKLLAQAPAWATDGAAAEHLLVELQLAMRWVALRAASTATSEDVQLLLKPSSVETESFTALPAAVDRSFAPDAGPDARAALLGHLVQCEQLARRWRSAAREAGTTAGLTHHIRSLREAAVRLKRLALVMQRGDVAFEQGAGLLAEMLVAYAERNSLTQLVRRSSADLAYRMTESASQDGEHYVANSRGEWAGLLRAACLAGVVIAFMAIVKIKIAAAHLPLLWEALLVCLNYGLGFVFIHLIHGTVATKQPAMTAAVLARRLAEDDGTPLAMQQTVDLCVKMARSQTIAVAGNVLVAAPVALLLYMLWPVLTGQPLINAAKAAAFIADASVWAGPALLFAGIAGCCLFLAGMMSGWFDNLAGVTRLSARLAVHPVLLRTLGADRSARFGRYIGEHLGALTGNLMFGFLLGGVSFLGVLTGTGLDIRHVAFSSANTTFAIAHAWTDMHAWLIPLLILGVLLIGVVNITVSFGLSLLMAVRARGAEDVRTGLLLFLLGRRLLRNPLQFLVPPKSGSGGASAGAEGR
jgi:site-specific recombinase